MIFSNSVQEYVLKDLSHVGNGFVFNKDGLNEFTFVWEKHYRNILDKGHYNVTIQLYIVNWRSLYLDFVVDSSATPFLINNHKKIAYTTILEYDLGAKHIVDFFRGNYFDMDIVRKWCNKIDNDYVINLFNKVFNKDLFKQND